MHEYIPITTARVRAPTPPQPRPRAPFPIVGALAPVVMSIAMWLVTGSALALMFAALGPAIAIANLVDSRVHGARAARRELARFEREASDAERDIDDAHDRERRTRRSTAPPAAQILAASSSDSVWAVAAPDGDAPVCLGLSRGASSVRLDGGTPDRGDDPVARRLEALRDRAAVLVDDPVVVPARGGIAVVGPRVPAEALARTIFVQLAAQCERAGAEISDSPLWREQLLGTGPLAMGESPPGRRVTAVDAMTIETGPNSAAVSSALDVLVRVMGARAILMRAPGLHEPREFNPEYTSSEEARIWARGLPSRTSSGQSLPTQLEFDPGAARGDDEHGSHGARATLACEIGRTDAGPCVVDLVRMGPHAVVGGTTGSGKSELLVTWALAMAARYSPHRLTYLLFDFKGGSSFGPVERLPHTVGLVTDLDADGAQRAIASLAAEVRFRERALAAAGVRHLDELADDCALPRLVVLVDELAAMVASFPELHAEFGDLAARGRSLGVHLVLCTQRPAGVVRDALMANVGLRLSLRVNNSTDSVAVIGTPQATTAGLPPGRVFLSHDGEVTIAQAAHATPEHVDAVCAQWAGGDDGAPWSPRRPWLAPLPAQIPLEELPAGFFALSDTPREQRQDPVRFEPEISGNLLVIGAARSGKSTALSSIAAARRCSPPIGADLERCWDALRERSRELLLIDDLDLVVALYGPEHQTAFLETLATVMRRGERRVVISAERWSAPVQSLASLCGTRLLLRMPTKQEHIMAGGESSDFTAQLVPGAGWLGGVRVQVAVAGAATPRATRSAASLDFDPATHPRLLVVARNPETSAAALVAMGWGHVAVLGTATPESADVVVGDVDGWQRHWQHFTTLSRDRPVLFLESSLSEVRTLTRARELPPPIADHTVTAWLLEPSGRFCRVRRPDRG